MSSQYRDALQNIIYPNGATWSGYSWGNPREPNETDRAHAEKEMTGMKAAVMDVPVLKVKSSTDTVATLKSLGFKNLSEEASKIADRSMKLNMIGFAGFKKIPYSLFQGAKDRISKNSEGSLELRLTAIEKYLGQHVTVMGSGGRVIESEISFPPAEALTKLSEAKKQELFDTYAVIHVAKVHDPILVGQVNGVEDLFFIAEWGDDITLEEIMK